jgi:hypothetical protein
MRLSLAGVFVVSAGAKALSWRETVQVVGAIRRGVRIGFERADRLGTWILIGVELASGTALLFGGRLARPGYTAVSALLAGFTLLALWSIRHDRRLPCACFGRPRTALGWRHVGRNAVLLAMSGAGLLLTGSPYRSLDAGGVVTCAVAALVVTVLVIHYDDIIDIGWGPTGASRPAQE